jgi:hypothetical protein
MEAKKQRNPEPFDEQTALGGESSSLRSLACYPDDDPPPEWIEWPPSE